MSNKRRILKFALCGAAIGSFVLFFFGSGLPMALFLAGEGAIMGFVAGSVVGVLRVLSLRTLDGKRDSP